MHFYLFAMFARLVLMYSAVTVASSRRLDSVDSAVTNTFVNDPVTNSQIFWDNLSDDQMLENIKIAEKALKIFIYPIPDEAKLEQHHEDLLPHFKTEYLFRKYLQDVASTSQVSASDARKLMLVSDASQANAFIIDHNWMRLTRTKCDMVTEKHLVPIINNVLHNYPYFYRNGGRDHFFMAIYDKGALCDMECFHDGTRAILNKISNVSFIGKCVIYI